ncbi:MAG: oligosaccharide flippase family protein, partial [Candidatus Omnitrophota bacterium]|nr:oligosaccharide flippase family protein [Candidatus Omnitrophota bacterium]
MENRDIFQKDAELENQEEERSLGKLAVKGGLWVFALKIFHRGLGLLRTIILARLLSPDDFGLMGIAVLAINTVETFS